MSKKLSDAIKIVNRALITCGSLGALALMSTAAVAQVSAEEKAEINSIEEVQVMGIRTSLINNIDAKRMATGVRDVITAEDIGKMPDKNVGDTLQRIAGVAVTTGSATAGGFGENEKVSIRGTDPNLNLTVLNGHSVGSGDWFVLDQSSVIGRSFSYSTLPSEIVGRLDVYKSQQADLVEGGIGGTVDVQTRKPLDLAANTIMGSVDGVYAELAEEVSPQVSALYSFKNDNETFGVLVQGFSQETEIRRDGVENILFQEKSDLLGDGSNVSATHAGLIGLSYFRQTRERKGGYIDVQIRPTDALDVSLTALQSDMKADNINSNFMIWQQTGSGLLSGDGRNTTPSSQVVDANGYLVAASYPSINDAGNRTEAVVQDDIFREAKSSTGFVDLDGTFQFNERSSVHLKVGTTEGIGETSFTPAWESLYYTGASYDQRTDSYDYRDLDSNPLNNTDTHYSWSWGGQYESKDTEDYAQVDFEFQFDGLVKSVKTGFRHADHERNVNSQVYDFAGNFESGANYITVDTNGDGVIDGSDGPLSMQFVSSGETTPSNYLDGLGVSTTVGDGAANMNGYPVSDFAKVTDTVLNYCAHAPDGSTDVQVTRTDIDGNATTATEQFCGVQFNKGHTSDFVVDEKTTAVYLMADLGGEGWSANIGARFIKTDVSTINWGDTPNAADPAFISTRMGTDWAGAYRYTEYGVYEYRLEGEYVNFLPSASIKFDLNDDLVLRLAAAETLARPGYRSIGGGVNLNTNNNTGTSGNPNLRPIEAANYSSSIEWYYDEGAVLSAEFFYIDFANFITDGSRKESFYVQDINNPNGSNVEFDLNTPINGSGGYNNGFALSLQHPFGNSGFGVITNYTYTDAALDNGDTPAGVSEDIFNLVGYYENDRFNVRAGYNYRSDIYNGLDFNNVPMTQKAYGQWDISANMTVTENVSLSFSWQNVTGETMEYVKETDPAQGTVINKYDAGGRIYAGVRVNF